MRGKNKAENPIVASSIGVDLLGSSIPPNELIKAIFNFSKDLKASINLHLFGLTSTFGSTRSPSNRITFQVAKEAITMEESPLAAIRHKRDSTISLGIDKLKKGEIQAFISAGNTGAIMACAKLKLPSLPHVDRPALLTLLPTRKSEIAVIDVGANTSSKASHLLQFAAMGIAYQKGRGIKKPKVGLLNIGSEARKGTPEHQKTYNQLLLASKNKSAPFFFAGNVEGRNVFHGELDVLVTDGFTGNVFLKTAEGIAGVILEELESSTVENCPTNFKTTLSALRQRLHYAEYPGALLCGIQGIVIKCHGDSSAQSILRSITTASRLIEHSFLDQVSKALKPNPENKFILSNLK